MPIFDDSQLQALFARFAPIWEVDVADGNDHIGGIRWQDGPQVDTNRPSEYRLLSYTLLNGRVLPQQTPQGERTAVRIGSARHYVERIYASNGEWPVQLDAIESYVRLSGTRTVADLCDLDREGQWPATRSEGKPLDAAAGVEGPAPTVCRYR